MLRPPVFPPPQFPPVRLRPFQRTPPAIFPPILGLMGLGLALRKAAEVWGLNGAVAEAVLGATVGLGAFAVVAYLAKVAQRPSVVAEDLRVLPGRAGLAAAVMGLLALAAALQPYSEAGARSTLVAGLALQAALAVTVAVLILRSPPEARSVTPVFHLHFVGFIVGGLSADAVGWPMLGVGLMLATLPVALAIWVASLAQIVAKVPPAPLRPLLAIHLAPAALLGMVAQGLGFAVFATICAAIGGLILLALIVWARWLLAAGFSPLWGALTFPLAAYAGLMLALWPMAGAVLLAAALLAIPPIAVRIMQDWAKGGLAARTNAATA
ncbi:tellurite resistance protein [Cereibacter ovatus]|uniref:Tellurite resistance protein n=1 Tax=Cereibacter ovatus TaxID=439529 RepID=A0A285D1T6_9RHOB|nr:tellurium resistance protein [Cereibacter ovatus]SNX73764.1 tellurite resistance protein [Cereibacter ovatus]